MNKKASDYLGVLLATIIFAAMGFYIFYNPIEVKPLNYTNTTTNISSTTTNTTTNLLPKVPGDVLTNNLTIICVSGYSATVRDVPQSLRLEVFKRDNVIYPQQTGTTELDHLVPLCGGGSNNINNLWVEFAEPRPGFHEKDILESCMCKLICNGSIDINRAQERIANDWYNWYLEIKDGCK